MLRPVDIPVFLKLTLPGASEMSFQQLASEMHLSSQRFHCSYKRARLSGFFSHDAFKSVNRTALLECLSTGCGMPFRRNAAVSRAAFQPLMRQSRSKVLWGRALILLQCGRQGAGNTRSLLSIKHAPVAALKDAKILRAAEPGGCTARWPRPRANSGDERAEDEDRVYISSGQDLRA